jgi:FkbM family methyltransferase
MATKTRSRSKRSREAVYRWYSAWFAKTYLYKFNKFLFNLGLRGIGILNYADTRLSGEECFLQKFSRAYPNPTVIDIGANVGRYSGRVRALMPEAEVYALEPHPASFEVLRKDAETAGYHALNTACGDTVGTRTLFDYDEDWGSSHASLHRDVIEHLHHGHARGVEVPVTTLEALAADYGLERIHLLKIDTEGHELYVMRGGRRLFEEGRIDVVHFEFNEMNIISRTFARDFLPYLEAYTFFRMLPNGLVPMGSYSPLFYELFAFQNLVAVRKDLLPGLRALLT